MKQLKKYDYKRVRITTKRGYQVEGLLRRYYDEVKNPLWRDNGAMEYYIETDCGCFELVRPKDVDKIELL